mgnify:FL=1
MDELKKLLRKVKRKDRERLLAVLQALRSGDIKEMNVKWLTNSQLYRIRVGDFRITFSIDRQRKTVVIESVRRRNEKTYR